METLIMVDFMKERIKRDETEENKKNKKVPKNLKFMD